MARSKLVLTVLGAAAALAVAGCGSVTAADAGSASSAGSAGSGSATTGPGSGSAAASPSGGGSAAPGPGQVNGTGGPVGGVSGLLCSAPGAVSQVIITRTGFAVHVLPTNPRTSAFTSATPPSPGLVVKGAGPARALAKALCGLPTMTGGILHCPKLGATSVRLAFFAGRRVLPAVIVQPSGCLTVTGAGPVRSAARSSAFLKLLTSVAGPLPLPGAVHLPGTAVSGGPLRPLATALG